MQRLLDVSMDLLAEAGVDGFNTNLLADRAGVGVRAIYRYFPNKLAILVALTESFRVAERAWIGDLGTLGVDGDWRRAADAAVDGYFHATVGRPGFSALRAAVQAIPELREIEHDAARDQADDLAQGLRALGIRLEEPHLRALCRVILESATRVLDVSLQVPPAEAELLVRELKRMIVSLLENYLD